MNYFVVKIEKKDFRSFLVYARKEKALPIDSPELFLIGKDSDLLANAQNALQTCQYWDVPFECFITQEDNPNFHEELITIDFNGIFKKALNTAIKARFSDIHSIFANCCTEKELLNNVQTLLDGDNKVYEAHMVTLKNGRVYKCHDIYPLYAENDDDAFKVALSVLQQREGRDIWEENLMTYEIKCNTPKQLFSNVKLVFKQKSISPTYKFTHPEQYKVFEEAMTFEGGILTASADEITIHKPNDTVFHASLGYLEQDFITETYVGKLSNGELFRFVFDNRNGPTALIEPMVSFGSISPTGWAVHYRVCL